MTSNKLRELLEKNLTIQLDHHRTSSGIEFSYKEEIVLDWKWYADSMVNLDEEKLDFIDEFVDGFIAEDEEILEKVEEIEELEKEDKTTWQEILNKRRNDTKKQKSNNWGALSMTMTFAPNHKGE